MKMKKKTNKEKKTHLLHYYTVKKVCDAQVFKV
jgi:hypothetical protein